jgi:FAD/FMN-containing dehydrogenase
MRNDEEGVGPNGIFSKQDRRVLWGSFGEFDLDAVWNTYFETREKYERLRAARRKADPDGVFTPNTFCVKR